jgi:hypothetical protein
MFCKAFLQNFTFIEAKRNFVYILFHETSEILRNKLFASFDETNKTCKTGNPSWEFNYTMY